MRQGKRASQSAVSLLRDERAWLELVLMGVDLVAWARMLLLLGAGLASYEPKRLRYRLLHVAGRIVRHVRGIRLRLPENWPWAGLIMPSRAPKEGLGAFVQDRG